MIIEMQRDIGRPPEGTVSRNGSSIIPIGGVGVVGIDSPQLAGWAFDPNELDSNKVTTPPQSHQGEERATSMCFEAIVGHSPALKAALRLAETVAPSDATVLLLGETGTGKELIARAIHEHSRRSVRPLVRMNCAAIPTGLLESELFGHERGAFTGAISQKVGRLEVADRGTLFLDEVGDIPIEIQPKLLRVLQEREFERLGSTHTRSVNVRIVAATHRDLSQMVGVQEFRSDLYYRLNVFPIRIPPLRERREDIPFLVSHFVRKFSARMQKHISVVPPSAMRTMAAWHWPGNIRELENFIERAVILTRGQVLEAPLEELHPIPRSAAPRPGLSNEAALAHLVRGIVTELQRNGDRKDEGSKQREEIAQALRETNGRVGGTQGAAERLGLKRTTLIARMKRLGIAPGDFSSERRSAATDGFITPA